MVLRIAWIRLIRESPLAAFLLFFVPFCWDMHTCSILAFFASSLLQSLTLACQGRGVIGTSWHDKWSSIHIPCVPCSCHDPRKGECPSSYLGWQ